MIEGLGLLVRLNELIHIESLAYWYLAYNKCSTIVYRQQNELIIVFTEYQH